MEIPQNIACLLTTIYRFTHINTVIWSSHFWRRYCFLTWNISSKSWYTELLLHFIWKSLKTLHASLFLVADVHITTTVWWESFWKRYHRFLLGIFHQKVCMQKSSYFLNWTTRPRYLLREEEECVQKKTAFY